MHILELFTGVTTNTTTPIIRCTSPQERPERCYQGTVVGTGALTATITLFGSVDGVNFSATPFGTITLSGSTSVTDNFASSAIWPFVRCVTASVTGTGATVNTLVAL